MAFWAAVEITLSAMGMYNITKGFYSMYCDADEIKTKYNNHKKTKEQYHISQTKNNNDPLTESQYINYKNDFIILKKEK